MEIATLLLIITNLIITYVGLRKTSFFNKYSFRILSVRRDHEYWRYITAGFLHVSWVHFIFNMIALASFGYYIEAQFGIPTFLILYFGSMIGAHLIVIILMNRFNDYFMVGASGAISGIMYACIAYNPLGQIGLWGILFFPSFIWAIFYTSYTIYGISKRIDYIGHEAHLGGGMIGLLIATAFNHNLVFSNILYITPVIIMIVIFWVYTFHTKYKTSDFSISLPKKNKQDKRKPAEKEFVKTGISINEAQGRAGSEKENGNRYDEYDR